MIKKIKFYYYSMIWWLLVRGKTIFENPSWVTLSELLELGSDPPNRMTSPPCSPQQIWFTRGVLSLVDMFKNIAWAQARVLRLSEQGKEKKQNVARNTPIGGYFRINRGLSVLSLRHDQSEQSIWMDPSQWESSTLPVYRPTSHRTYQSRIYPQ